MKPTSDVQNTGRSDADPKRLVLYYNGAFINRENGAHARFLELLQWARAHFPGVIVYSFADHPSCPWGAQEIARFREEFPDVELRLDRRRGSLLALTRFKNMVCALAPRYAAAALELHMPGASPKFDDIRSNPGSFVLIANYVEGMTELNGLNPDSGLLIETHDVKFLQYAKRRRRALSDLRVIGKFRSEVCLLQRAAGLIAIAPPEAGMFRLWFPDKQVFYVPKYLPATGQPAPGAGDRPFLYDLLFVGSENGFNVEGLGRFLREYGPWLADRRLMIAGRICLTPQIKTLAATLSGVSLAGYVEDLSELYRESKAVISPVEGTGLKIKVLDALAAGKPVLGSEHTLQGLPAGYDGCVFPLSPQMADRLLADDDMRRRAEGAAVAYSRTLEGAGDAERLRAFIAERLRCGD